MSTRTCITKGCGTSFTPGRTGHGDRCARCQTTIARGGKPGPRQRAAPGEAVKTENVTAWLTEEQRNALDTLQAHRERAGMGRRVSRSDLIGEAVDMLLKRERRAGRC